MKKKKKILADAGIALDIDAKTGLAMKAVLYYALEPTLDIKKVIRHLCENKIKPTFLCSDGWHISRVQLGSEKRQRLITKDILGGENVEAEVAPFCVSRPSCDDEIRAAAYAYTPSLIQKDQPCR